MDKVKNDKSADIQKFRVADWFEIRGDETLRLDYDLNPDSVVFDVGGYHGDWADAIYKKYQCYIYIFEPIGAYAEIIRKRFEGNEKIKVFPVGLSDENKKIKISVQEDSTSLYKQGEKQEEVELIDASDFIKKHSIQTIDLLKSNIEGGEYDLLDGLIASGKLDMIHDLQIQFHDFVEDAQNKLRNIQEELRKKYFLTYQFEFVWENWRKKRIPSDLAEAQLIIEDLYFHLDKINKNNLAIRNSQLLVREHNTQLSNAMLNCTKENDALKKEILDYKKSKIYQIINVLSHPFVFFSAFFKFKSDKSS